MPDPTYGPAPPEALERWKKDYEADYFNHLENRRAIDAVYAPARPENIVRAGVVDGRPQKLHLYDAAFRTLGNVPITYLEFGVFKGWSIEQIAMRFSNPDSTFFGFDSFKGLPEKWLQLKAGTFSTDGAFPTINDSRVHFVKGWFQDSLPKFLNGGALSQPLLVHFDADLYSATLFLLSTLWHHVPEYYFLFDEFVPNEIVALFDFARAYPVDLKFFAATEAERQTPHQVFGHLKKSSVHQPPPPAGA